MIKTFFFLVLCLLVSSCSSSGVGERAVASYDLEETGVMCGTREVSSHNGQHFTVKDVGESTPVINTVNGQAFMEADMFMTKGTQRVSINKTFPPVAQLIVEDGSIKSIKIRYAESKADQTPKYSNEINYSAHHQSEDGKVTQSSTLIKINDRVYDYLCWFVSPIKRF